MKMQLEENTLVLENTQPRGFCLPRVADEAFTSKKVDLEKLLDKEENGKTLLPGENTVSKELWNYAKKNSCVKMALRGGHLKIIRSGIAVPLNTDWGKAPPDKLREFLSNLHDVEKINSVKLKVGKRKKHLDLCEKRIDELLDEASKA